MGLPGDVVNRHAALALAAGELLAEAALPDAGLAHDPHHLRLPRQRALEGGLEAPNLIVAPDEPGEAACSRSPRTSGCTPGAGELVHAQRPARALHLELAEVGERQVVLDEPRRVLCQVDPVGRRELLHPLREADRVADRGVVHAEVVADRAHDDLARVEPSAHREAEAARATQLGGVGGELALQVEGGVARAPRVVLVGDRRAEEGHDAVARELVDGALEAVDALAEDREEAGHDRAPLLGVRLLGELHRAHHVGEQDGHLLSLALERCPPGADLLGEVRRQGRQRRPGRGLAPGVRCA